MLCGDVGVGPLIRVDVDPGLGGAYSRSNSTRGSETDSPLVDGEPTRAWLFGRAHFVVLCHFDLGGLGWRRE